MPKCRKSLKMKRFFRRILADSRGTSAVEYGIICAMIFIGLVSAVAGLAEQTSSMWTDVSSKSKDAIEKTR